MLQRKETKTVCIAMPIIGLLSCNAKKLKHLRGPLLELRRQELQHKETKTPYVRAVIACVYSLQRKETKTAL